MMSGDPSPITAVRDITIAVFAEEVLTPTAPLTPSVYVPLLLPLHLLILLAGAAPMRMPTFTTRIIGLTTTGAAIRIPTPAVLATP